MIDHRLGKDALDILVGKNKNSKEIREFIAQLIKNQRSQEYHRIRRESPFKDYTDMIVSSVKNIVEEILRDDPSDKGIDAYYRMVEKDPFVRACCELKALRTTIAFGRYENPNKTIENWINENFEQMDSVSLG